jgi:NAD(P)-dependent dehydrogenase (short-subunit alcohol dehydrogenase family)
MKIMDLFSLKGNVSIVTGAASGLGRVMAKGLAQAGSNIVIIDLDLEKAKETAEEIEKEGVDVLAIQADVTNRQQIDNAVSQTIEKYGKIDSLFNNAGITIHKSFEEVPENEWDKVMDVNLKSMYMMSQAVGRIMIQQKKGTIVNTSSMSGLIVNVPQKQLSYNTSKAGVIMLTKSLAIEWVDHNIRVNTIAPGYMKTDMTAPFFEEDGPMVKKWMDLIPMKRPGNPEELAGMAVYLASEASSYVTGSVFTIDGGYCAI